MDFQLTEEQQMIRKMVRDFAEKEIAPIAQETDKSGLFPWQVIRKMGKLGLMGLPFSEEYGGAGADTISYAIAIEEISRVCGSMAITLAAHISLCTFPIYRFGSEEQKRRYVPKLASGEWIGALGLTEPGAGSDAGGIKTRAVLDGDKWVINGQKCFITNGSIADVVVLTAVTDPERGSRGISSFIVEKGTPGFRPGRDEEKMGLKGSITSELFFEDCRIPKENILGSPGEGFKQALITLDGGRISIGGHGFGAGSGSIRAGLSLLQGAPAVRPTYLQFPGHPVDAG
jgi:butyryl-CoA dehydrogenase